VRRIFCYGFSGEASTSSVLVWNTYLNLRIIPCKKLIQLYKMNFSSTPRSDVLCSVFHRRFIWKRKQIQLLAITFADDTIQHATRFIYLWSLASPLSCTS
jgi:hypothetical protein